MDEKDSHTPTAWLDPELEQRLTAWVLGEASDYEIAALEEMVKSDRRARVYLDELRVVHGHLQNDSSVDDDAWRLSEDKRTALMKRFGQPSPSAKPLKLIDWPRCFRGAASVAACLALCGAVWKLREIADQKDTFSSAKDYVEEAPSFHFESQLGDPQEVGQIMPQPRAAPEPSSSSTAQSRVITAAVVDAEAFGGGGDGRRSIGTPSTPLVDVEPFGGGGDFGDGLGRVDADEERIAQLLPRKPQRPAAPAPPVAQGQIRAKTGSRLQEIKDVRESRGRTIDESLAQQALGVDAFAAVEEEMPKKLDAPPPIHEPLSDSALTPTADEPVSTFSLNVSDVSYQQARAAVMNAQPLDPATIRVEEFYNAFDYGDRAPRDGEPVACVIEQSTHPTARGQNLLRIGIRTAAEGRSAQQPLNITVLLDNSGSMQREDRSLAVAQAFNGLARNLAETDQLSVIGFASQPRLIVDRANGAEAGEAIMRALQTPSEGGTNLERALETAANQAIRQQQPSSSDRIVLLTDGGANLGLADAELLVDRVIALRQQGIALDTFGVGAGDLNDRLLEQVTRNGDGRYFALTGVAEQAGEFADKIAGAFRPAAENVKVQVIFNPERVESYRLNGFREHRLAEEDFRDDSVDGAELAAEESGNALYNLKVKDDGLGNIGTVSVRFRDVASDRMVERQWTIPYQPSPPAFTDSPPSLQLAGLANGLGEILQGAPVEGKNLDAALRNVRRAFPHDGAVEDFVSFFERAHQ